MTATRGNYQESPASIFHHSLWEESATKKHRLGTIRRIDDGREFVYCQAGASNIAAGVWCQSAIVTNYEDTLTANMSAGGKTVTITEAGQAAGITLNQFEDGFLVVNSGTGIGEILKIKSHAAIANASTGNINFYDACDTTLTTASNISMYTNPYKAVLIGNAAATKKPICLTQRPVTANYYFWGLQRGLGAMQLDANGGSVGTELDEKLITPSIQHDGLGEVKPSPDANLVLEDHGHRIGELLLAADITDNEAALIYVSLG